MRDRMNRTVAVGWTLLSVVRDSQLTLLAAAIAYYAFASLLPLFLVVLTVASAVGGDALAKAVVTQLSGALTPSGESLVRNALTNASGRGSVTAIGLAILLWSGLKLFRGLDTAFSMVYGTEQSVTLLTKARNAVTALVAVGAAIGAVVLAAVAAGIVGLSTAGIPTVVGLPFVLTVAFLPLYYIFPDVEMTLRDAVPGAVFAAVGWTVLSAAFQVYAVRARSAVLYGILGAVLLLVTWFYVGGIVLLLGAVLNGVLAGDVGAESIEDRQLQQGRLPDTEQRMSDSGADNVADGTDESRRDDVDVAELRAEIDALQERIDERTLHRDEIERDLKRYVRKRVRRGHATGWGPYLVLLYGTVMTLGAFYFLSGWVAVASMLVIWLSTLGLYALMLLVGVTVNTVGVPWKLLDKVRDFRR
ncbi:YihY/virulence factor BrkB family protein [Halapricum desulfuricans]|uniref:Putative conserved domain associated withmembrane ribonuclease BN n=1 Tax=Halapricum desulfuricans TaxID=2841257 RepID=A0A897NT30_9EURY|nr:YihY/virulence factor BrkB family protein [Halapricum desulfuricans]QSG15937.1 putative conserved domain associated withmembrane ribonuclease BN [Halapricum desulfuricans]